MNFNIVLDDGAKMPQRAHDTDAGFDLFAREDVLIRAHESVVIDTGVHIELKETNGYKTVGMLKSKSGLNVNFSLTNEGVIDMGYTGSIRVKLYNHSNAAYIVHKGDKISQLVIMPIVTPELVEVDELAKTERGDGGFGSTGR